MRVYLTAWFVVSLASAAPPGGFSISPIRLEFGARQSTAIVTVENSGAIQRTYQVTPVVWDQVDGKDRYEPARNLIAVPPMFTIAPGARQLVRVGVMQTALVERTFRLLVQELPQSKGPDVDGLQIETLLRVSVPVFVSGLEPSGAPKLKWTARADCFDVENEGAGHLQIQKLRLGPGPEHSMGAFYILSGKKRELCVPDIDKSSPLPGVITAQTDRGVFSYEVLRNPN